MSAVWVVRDASSEIQAAFPTEKLAVNYTHGWVGDGLLSVTRETLLTPKMAAVIAMAFKHRENPNLDTARQLHHTVDTLRAQEGE